MYRDRLTIIFSTFLQVKMKLIPAYISKKCNFEISHWVYVEIYHLANTELLHKVYQKSYANKTWKWYTFLVPQIQVFLHPEKNYQWKTRRQVAFQVIQVFLQPEKKLCKTPVENQNTGSFSSYRQGRETRIGFTKNKSGGKIYTYVYTYMYIFYIHTYMCI